jgi:small subunit ribosomal protein S21
VIPAERENSEKPTPTAPPTNGHAARDSGGNREGGRDGGAQARFDGGDRPSYGDRPDRGFDRDRPKAGAMEVTVEHNIEKAMKILKRKLIKEGLFKELKSRRYYEKPSERRKRKHKESVKKIRKEESRAKKNQMLAS